MSNMMNPKDFAPSKWVRAALLSLFMAGVGAVAASAAVLDFTATFQHDGTGAAVDLTPFMPADTPISLAFRLDVGPGTAVSFPSLSPVSGSLTWTGQPSTSLTFDTAEVSVVFVLGVGLTVYTTSPVVGDKQISRLYMNWLTAENALTTTKSLFEILSDGSASLFDLGIGIKSSNGTEVFNYASAIRSSSITDPNLSPVPLPAALPLLGAGIAAIGGLRILRRRKPAGSTPGS